MIRGRSPVRILYGFLYLLLISPARAFPQDVTLVYEPDVRLRAGGPISYLEERVDEQLTLQAKLVSPGLFADYIQKNRSDGSLRRLAWNYIGAPQDGNYTIEEQDSQPDGTWTVSATLEYRNGVLITGQFFSGENLVEKRQYEYDRDKQVTSELTSRPYEDHPVILDFERPDANTVEAFERQPDSARLIVARLQYDEEGRLSLEERFARGKLAKREVYTYNVDGKLIEHIRYDEKEQLARRVSYGYTSEGLPSSVVHRDAKDRILYGLTYVREQYGEYSKTIIKNSSGEVTGSIDYLTKNGKDVRRTDVFLLGAGKLDMTYSEFDEYGNWLRKELSTYDGSSLKERTITRRTIHYFD